MNETTKKMLAELDAAIEECLWIPNEHLPEEFHDDREGGKTLKRLNEQADKVEAAKAEFQPVKSQLSFTIRLKVVARLNVWQYSTSTVRQSPTVKKSHTKPMKINYIRICRRSPQQWS